MKYLIPALLDFGEMLKGRRVSPVDLYETARKSLHFVGYQGLSMIAVAGLDMAAWDALAKAAGVPLCVLLGGSVGPVNAYNSNGLWLQSPESAAAEAVELLDERGGGSRALKLRLGRADPRDDLATIKAVRDAIGDDIDLMVDFNQALKLADALRRCHMIDEHGLVWIEEVLYDDFDSCARLTAELKTPIQIGENFYGPRDVHFALQKKACDLIMPDFMRIGGVTGFLRSAAIAGAQVPHIDAFLSRSARMPSAHRKALTGMAGLSYLVLQRHRRNPRRAVHPRGAGRRHRVDERWS
jgi:mandelate racemase